MDLESIDLVTKSVEGVKMTLKHPTTGQPIVANEETGEQMYVKLTGPYHPDFKRKDKEITDSRFAKRKFKFTAEEIRAEQIELAVVSVREWNIVIGGAVPDTKPGTVRRILSDDKYSWIREQITNFLNDEENFLS